MHETELRHFGVKGMKWGVRKSPEERALRMDGKAASTESKRNAHITPRGNIRSGKLNKVRNIDYRVEKYRRKADAIREKAFNSENRKVGKDAYASALKKTATWPDKKFKDRREAEHLENALITAAIFLVAAPMVRRQVNLQVGKLISNKRLDRKRAERAYSMTKKIVNSDKMKPGAMYVVNSVGKAVPYKG